MLIFHPHLWVKSPFASLFVQSSMFARTYNKMSDHKRPRRTFVIEVSLMESMYDRCCGIDVHKKLIVACFKNAL